MNMRMRKSIYFPRELLERVPGNFCSYVEAATLYALIHPEIRGELRQLQDKREDSMSGRSEKQ